MLREFHTDTTEEKNTGHFVVCYFICAVHCSFSKTALISALTDLIKEVLSMDDEIQKLATELYHQKSVLIMGRGYHYATCLEGALVRCLT